jgi:glycosyltransferase involved in cell wall biosynthesis
MPAETRGRPHPRARVLVYVNHVYADDLSGRGTFERELVAALRKHVRRQDGARLELFTARRPGDDTTTTADTARLLLDKSRATGHMAHQVRLGWALLRALVRHRRDDVTIYARYSVTSIAPVALATLFGRRFVMRTGPALKNLAIYDKHPSPAAYLAIRLSYWWNCRKASAIIVVTPQIQRYVESLYAFTRGKTMIVPNGVNVERFPVCPPDRARWGLAEEGLVLGFVGSVYVDQGLDTVIHALAGIQRETGSAPQLLVVGDGPCRGPWAALARQLGVESRVVFAGQRPYDDIASAIAACDIMLAPFTRRSFAVTGSSALKLFEYFACDKPVLASRGEDHQFLADAGVGWLVEPEDVEAWISAIRARMDAPAYGLGGRGRRLVEQRYSYQAIAERVWRACFAGEPTSALRRDERIDAIDTDLVQANG